MTINSIITFIAKLAGCLLVLMLMEGLITFGRFLDFENYSFIGWFTQILLIILTIYTSLLDWETGKLPE